MLGTFLISFGAPTRAVIVLSAFVVTTAISMGSTATAQQYDPMRRTAGIEYSIPGRGWSDNLISNQLETLEDSALLDQFEDSLPGTKRELAASESIFLLTKHVGGQEIARMSLAISYMQPDSRITQDELAKDPKLQSAIKTHVIPNVGMDLAQTFASTSAYKSARFSEGSLKQFDGRFCLVYEFETVLADNRAPSNWSIQCPSAESLMVFTVFIEKDHRLTTFEEVGKTVASVDLKNFRWN